MIRKEPLETPILTCFHCGNDTPHKLLLRHTASLLYEQIESEKYYEPFLFLIYKCGTCQGLSLVGAFEHEFDMSRGDKALPRLYPVGSQLVPPSHMLRQKKPVPDKLLQIYQEAWPLRKKSPSAFVNQIRRALEFICHQKNARGETLSEKLVDLSAKEIFPSNLTAMSDLIRRVGNIGSHADESEVDIWDAELVDDFFRAVVEYVYIAPEKIERLKQRIGK